MSDCPQQIPDGTAAIRSEMQPFTVIVMMSDDLRSDECCAADWVRRVWVYGDPSDTDELIERARSDLSDMFGWTDQETGLSVDEVNDRTDALEPVAIYPGHLFDIYQP